MNRLAAAFGLLAASSLAAAASFKIDCPAQIPNSSLRVADTPAGWRATVVSPLFLHNAAPLDGPPINLGTLIGESLKDTPNHWITRYPLNGEFPKGKWITCDYGLLNEVSLSKRLPDETKECTVTGRKGKYAGQNTFDIVCRD